MSIRTPLACAFAAVFLALAAPGAAIAAGAIAVDDEAGSSGSDAGYGIVTGYDSRDAAGAAALKECKKQGNTACKVVVRFDECGAYASSRDKYGVGWGKSERDATMKALDACGSGSCKVVISDCE